MLHPLKKRIEVLEYLTNAIVEDAADKQISEFAAMMRKLLNELAHTKSARVESFNQLPNSGRLLFGFADPTTEHLLREIACLQAFDDAIGRHLSRFQSEEHA